VSLGPGDGRIQPSRVDRTDASVRRRRVYALVAVGVVVAVGIAALQIGGDDDGAAASPSVAGSASPPAASNSADLLALSVTGAPNALLAVVGTGAAGTPGALVLPQGMTLVVPGQGETVTEDVQTLPGDSMRVGVSNAIGTWADHYAVMDLARLGRVVDGAGGISANLPDAYPLAGTVLGPGKTHMTGDQVVTFLRADADDTDLRWAAVLEGLLEAAPNLTQDDLAQTDDAVASAATMKVASGAEVQVAPTQVVGGTVLVASQPEFDELVGRIFGTPVPVRALVQNGSGAPGIGEAVGRDLIPAGFRIVLSENASTFDHATTTITATGDAHLEDADAAKRALGVGEVQVTQVPSGLADVTIVVGSDFQG
jgi:LytR cell envelope-related transcriptional attenuator/LytR_cpsA_psr family